MTNLDSSDRKYLRSIAHSLKPLVMVGKHGMTDALVQAVDEALDAHELIKMKFIDHKGEKQSITDEVASGTQCTIAGIIGNVAVLYRAHKDPEKRKINLKRRK